MDGDELLKIENLTTDGLPKNRREIIIDTTNNRRIEKRRYLLFKTRTKFFKICLWKMEETAWDNTLLWGWKEKHKVGYKTDYRIEILRYAFKDSKGWQFWCKPNVENEKEIYDMIKKMVELLGYKNPTAKEDFISLVSEMFGNNLEILNGERNEQ